MIHCRRHKFFLVSKEAYHDRMDPTGQENFGDFIPFRLDKIASPKVYTENSRRKLKKHLKKTPCSENILVTSFKRVQGLLTQDVLSTFFERQNNVQCLLGNVCLSTSCGRYDSANSDWILPNLLATDDIFGFPNSSKLSEYVFRHSLSQSPCHFIHLIVFFFG